jgi:hypothetical protein
MGVWRLVYDKNVLKRLWAAGKTHVEIAAALGCSAGYVEKLRIRHGLPRRPQCHHGPQEDDPTPEQIAERAAECRARREQPAVPKTERVSAPKYSWDGYRFNGVS